MRKSVLTCGVFDLFHEGHAAFLRACARFGEELHVAVMKDEWTRKEKGLVPTYDLAARRKIVESVKGVTATLEMDTIDPTEAMKATGCRVFVHGNDWLLPGEDIYRRLPTRARHYIVANRIALLLIPYTSGVSTSQIRQRLSGRTP